MTAPFGSMMCRTTTGLRSEPLCIACKDMFALDTFGGKQLFARPRSLAEKCEIRGYTCLYQ